MELKIKACTFPEVIEFNFDELKQEITSRVEMYKNLVYTEEQTRQAKADLAQLRKFVKALSDERIKVKKQCLKPYEEFEAKVNELSKIVQEPIGLIDRQVKEYEEKQRAEKLQQIQELFGTIGFQSFVTLDKIFDEKWLNASVSLKKIGDDMREKMYRIGSDVHTISQLSEFAFEALEEYKTTLDINKAIYAGARMAEVAKAKAEAERVKAEQEAEQARLAEEAAHPTSQIGRAMESIERQAFENAERFSVEEQREWIGFKAYLTVNDAQALANLFAARGVPYEPINL